jgi:hypothetical protein
VRKVKKEYEKRNLNYKIAFELVPFEDLTPIKILNKLQKVKENKNEQIMDEGRNRNTHICKRQKKNKSSK